MRQEQLRLLKKMKLLVKSGRRMFAVRKDRNYIEELLKIGISVETAWQYILDLKPQFYIEDKMPTYKSSPNTLVFKRDINGMLTYIKLELVFNDGESVVCWSFHIDDYERKW